MKKGLSVLLIAAALFGFYGGATNLNDVLACKDYFTSASGASDDMQRLEDGLNQLKENEQAYLDGQVALAEGEKTLADGYATLADGERQYAEGLAAYKAAPGQLAAGEKQLAEGEKSYDDLMSLISGLKTAQKHGKLSTKKHNVYWHDAFDNSLRPGRRHIVKGLKDPKVALLEKLTGTKDLAKKASSVSDYRDFDKVVTDTLIPTFKKAATKLDAFAGLATEKADDLQNALDAYNGLTAPADAEQPGLESIWKVKMLPGPDNTTVSFEDLFGNCTAENEYKAVSMKKSPYAKLKPAFAGMSASPYYSGAKASVLLLGGVGQQMKDFLDSDNGKMLQGIGAEGDANKATNKDASLADKVAALVQGMTALSGLTGQNASDGPTFTKVAPQVVAGLYDAADLLKDSAKEARANAGKFKEWHDGYDTLNDGKNNQLASHSDGLPYAFKNMATNKTIKAAVKKYDKSLMKEIKKYKGNRLSREGYVAFDEDLVHISKDVIPRCQKVLAHVKSDANKQLADGRAQLAEGYKSYKEAPGKLADARQQLAEGRQALADGEKQLEDGKAQLAQYEDGEQQVRDGLATLVGTDAMGNVQSIADRIGNDTDFDNGDTHLELDEGLSAVQAGKGYAADLTAAVTDEIMGRAVGTGLLIGAGVLAVLAALLSFLKKNKGAGVFAVLAALAGCIGAVMGNNAGTQFSSIAGSAVGATPWIAAGILAAVAAVHAIVHFAAKKAA